MIDSSALYPLPQLDVSQMTDEWEEHLKVMIPGQHFEAIYLFTRVLQPTDDQELGCGRF